MSEYLYKLKNSELRERVENYRARLTPEQLKEEERLDSEFEKIEWTYTFSNKR